MATLTRVGTQTASAASLQVPAHLPGDIIFIGGARFSSATPPTVPVGLYAQLLTKAQSTNVSMAVGFRVALGIGAVSSASQNTSTGVWTTAANSFVVGQAVQITDTLPGGFSANTTYYVMAANLTSTTCQLSTTQTGAVKVPTSSTSTTLDTDPSGTWTNAAEMTCTVFRPSAGFTAYPGVWAANSSTTTTVNYPADSLADGFSGNTWVYGVAAANNTTQSLGTAPSGMTNQTHLVGSVGQIASHDTNGGVTSWSSTNVTAGTGDSVSAVVEIMLLPTTLPPNVYQHRAGGGNPWSDGQTGNTFKIPLPNPIGAGNTIVIHIAADDGTAVSSLSGAVNGAFTLAVTATAGASHQDSYVYVKTNCTAGGETLTAVFAGNVTSFQYDVTELYGVSTAAFVPSSGVNVQEAAPVQVIATGSLTPPNNNSTGGNLVWTHFVKSDQVPGHQSFQLAPGQNLTFLNADIGWKKASDGLTTATAIYLQAAQAAINPRMTSVNEATSGGDDWNAVVVVFPISVGAGTPPPSGMRINGIQHFTSTNYPTGATPYNLQVCTTGNLRVLASVEISLNVTSVTDSEGNTWVPDGNGAGFWYLDAAHAVSGSVGPNPNLQIIINNGAGATATLSWRFFDIAGAANSAFDSSALTNGQTLTGLTSFTSTVSPAPTSSSGITIANVGLETGPGLSVTGPSGAIWCLCTYTGETDTDKIENADIGAYYAYSASGTQTWGFTLTSQSPNQTSGGGFASFKAAPLVPANYVAPRVPVFPGYPRDPRAFYLLRRIKPVNGPAVTSTALSSGIFAAGTFAPSNLSLAEALSGVLAAVASETGSVSVASAVSSVLAAAASETSTMGVANSLAGTIGAAASMTGSSGVANALSSSLVAVASATGPIGISISISGTLSAVASLLGGISVQSGLPLSGTLAAVGSITGSLANAIALSGSLSAVASETGPLAVANALSGTMSAVASDVGTLGIRVSLSGSLAAVASILGSLSSGGSVALSSVLGAIGTLTSSLGNNLALASVVAATASSSSPIGIGIPLAGTIGASGSLIGGIVNGVAFAGQVAAIASITNSGMAVSVALRGVMAASAFIGGNLVNASLVPVGEAIVISYSEGRIRISFQQGVARLALSDGRSRLALAEGRARLDETDGRVRVAFKS